MQAKDRTNGEVAGVILAGGRSTRMGGGDKALLDLGGKPMLSHVIERLARQARPLAINANGDAARFGAFRLPVVADTMAEFAGPLAGVLAGLRWAKAAAPDACFVVSVPGDAPFLPVDLVSRLLEASARSVRGVVVAESGGRVHPVVALWPVDIADTIEAELRQGHFKAHRFIDSVGAAVESFALDHGVDPFFNANTPEELDAARELYARRTRPPRLLGIAGWKNSGKTTLAVGLIYHLRQRGLTVAAIKHSHHELAPDAISGGAGGTDSARFVEAGAWPVAVVSPSAWGLVAEAAHPEPEPDLGRVIARLGATDVIIVEGYKRAPITKVEVRRREARSHEPLAGHDPRVIAIAADHAVEDAPCPVFGLDDIAGLADLVLVSTLTSAQDCR